jgi:hypothetical protein
MSSSATPCVGIPLRSAADSEAMSAGARPSPPRPPGPGTAAPCCAPRRPSARSPGRRRPPRTSAAGSLAHVASTLSRPASRPPSRRTRRRTGPAQGSSNTPPPQGVADFRSEWPTSSRNHRPTSNRNQWPTCSGIRTLPRPAAGGAGLLMAVTRVGPGAADGLFVPPCHAG